MNLETTEHLFTITINGQDLEVDFSRMHPTVIAAHLKKSAQRFLNDKYSGESGQTKLDLVRADLHLFHSGAPMPERERKASVSKADPVQALARDKAATFLATALTAKLGKDMSVWAKQPQLAKLFRFTEKGAARFDMAALDQWIADYKARDFIAEAREELAQATAGMDFADLGL